MACVGKITSTVIVLTLLSIILVPGWPGQFGSASGMSNFNVAIDLEVYHIEMVVSTEHDTSQVVPGWVDVTNLRVGETLSVQLLCRLSSGFNDLYAAPDPSHMIFERNGRQYFNLTATMLEDAPITDDYQLILSAEAKTYIDYANSFVELKITPNGEISATADVASRPSEASPGGTATGELLVTNTGSIYGEYSLLIVDDPGSVVDEIAFTRGAELTPGFYEEFEFRVEVTEDASPGTHEVSVQLWASTQYDTGGPMDTFTMEVRVADPSGGVSGTLIISVIVILAVLGAAAFLVRRKA
jgi:hypothetical protein